MQEIAFMKKRDDRRVLSRGCRIYMVVERKEGG